MKFYYKVKDSDVRREVSIHPKYWDEFTALCEEKQIAPKDVLLRFIYMCTKRKRLVWPLS